MRMYIQLAACPAGPSSIGSMASVAITVMQRGEAEDEGEAVAGWSGARTCGS